MRRLQILSMVLGIIALWQLRTTASLSACLDVCGNNSLIQMPPLPYCAHVRGEPIKLLFDVPIAVITLPKLAGIGWPCISFNFGFGSSRSMWLGAPPLKMRITDFALPFVAATALRLNAFAQSRPSPPSPLWDRNSRRA